MRTSRGPVGGNVCQPTYTMSSAPVRVSTASAVTGREMKAGSTVAWRPSTITVEDQVSPMLSERATRMLTSRSVRLGWTPLRPQ